MYFNWAHGLPLNAVLDPSHPFLRVQDVRDFLKAFGLVSFPRISGAMVKSDSLSYYIGPLSREQLLPAHRGRPFLALHCSDHL